VRENSRLKTNVGECKEGWTQRTSGILDFVASKEKERRRHVIMPSLYCIIEINQQIPEFLDARFLSKHHVPTGRHDVALARAKKDSTLYEDRPLLLLFTLALALARSIYLSIYRSTYYRSPRKTQEHNAFRAASCPICKAILYVQCENSNVEIMNVLVLL
jgi:hypothetical protein